ncbi:S8 family peptidase [Bradyrhizobium sp. CCGUVB1N3]|uniref:S8 family peptidase n=1 Tax=Bradyrhizobium sp. CCGUVB1N3 TaxID=2949629 RepID=UPI0020B300FC|nr:S8 family peptidase [Bradyrhizobium sp. CCGUVB1N3]MCP3477473.1 S8 family peptidase [Bradyrhizobium sp. CCGUVB1N3]
MLFVDAAGTERYTADRGRSPKFDTPDRDRAQHAATVINALQTAQNSRGPFPTQVGNGFYESPGLTLTFESEPGFPLAFESLDLRRSKIQLLAVTRDEETARTYATIHVPDDKIQILLRKFEKYRDAEDGDERDNRKLVESITNIKLATLSELWTDTPQLYPAANTAITWEVWLRSAMQGENSPSAVLREAAPNFGYEVISNDLSFIDRTVVLVRGTREQLALSSDVLGVIAEVRKAKVTADFYSMQPAADQHALSAAFIQRLGALPGGSPVVALLDTGVNRAHPLLAPIVAETDVDGFKPGWGGHDSHRHGHGTQMAGLAIYGDLTPLFAGSGPIEITHGVQSLKLYHAPDPHRPELYGAVTIEGISRLEIDAARRKAFCMAISAEARERGRPTSWSAAVDNLAYGAINDTRRLIILSAGNTPPEARRDYPAYNEASSIEDPGQSWNALTVGGYTDRIFIDDNVNFGWNPLASRGDLAPSSKTSMTWPRSTKTPYKPDIVMEAGNMGRPPGDGDPLFLPELQLLTTSNEFAAGEAPFVEFHDTSAAAALAANLAARVMARYPDYSPETVRGLLVHSARWTDAMRARAVDRQGRLDPERMLRTFGYGAPDPERLFYSAGNALTLIAEDSLQPFFKDRDGSIKTKDIKFHELPWPRDALLALPFDTPVEMRVTLSYFVEPSPGERGWDRKYGYPSHGLRFRVIRATETLDDFKLRINAHDREDDYDETHAGETGRWELGVRGPTNGSIHSNIWRGSAAELAQRNHIAVLPTLGWWRTRPAEKRVDKKARYTLIVSISTPDENVDIYTPVAVQIGIENVVEIET